MIIFGGNDAFLRGREAKMENPLEKQKAATHIVPEKFREDIKALTEYIGEERFKHGISIEVTLAELLDVIPRKRRRRDAYTTLIKYLRDECQITLTLTTSKSRPSN